jgi:RNA polymerase sigma-70 factor (ECF subfamily)
MRAEKLAKSEEEILEGIRAGGIQREKAVFAMHRQYKGLMQKGMKKYRLSIEEAQDAYADAVIAISESVSQESFRSESRLSTYLFRIFMNKAVDKIRKKTTHKSKVTLTDEIPEVEDQNPDPLVRLIQKERMEEVRAGMELLGARCRELLWKMSYWGYKPAEVAIEMGFSNAQVVSSQRYKCMKQLSRILGKSTKNN